MKGHITQQEETMNRRERNMKGKWKKIEKNIEKNEGN